MMRSPGRTDFLAYAFIMGVHSWRIFDAFKRMVHAQKEI
jgi:hypothetical protein